jgi:branched-chain amino acid transport system ATP-binding protein
MTATELITAAAESLEVADLTVSYGDHLAVEGITLELPPGQARALLGPNGSGKSTVLNTIAGRYRPTGGTIRYGDRDLGRIARHAVPAAGVVLCPQEREVFATLSVSENLELGGYLHRRDRNGNAARRDRVLEIFPKLRALIDRQAGSLSGGEQQMLAIGRALMARPSVLLLDEPSAGLAPIVVTTIFDVLGDLAAGSEMSILVAEQNVPKAFRVTTYAYVLSNGRLHHEGPTDRLASDPQIATAYLGGYGTA